MSPLGIGFKPANIPVHPPPKTAEGKLIFFVLVSSVPEKCPQRELNIICKY